MSELNLDEILESLTKEAEAAENAENIFTNSLKGKEEPQEQEKVAEEEQPEVETETEPEIETNPEIQEEVEKYAELGAILARGFFNELEKLSSYGIEPDQTLQTQPDQKILNARSLIINSILGDKNNG